MAGSRPHLASDEFLTFIEMRGFSDDWKALGLGDSELEALQFLLMADPLRSSVMQGTGGLRKLRFAPASWNRGKRDSIRICYVHFVEFRTVLLVFAYPKSKKDDLDSSERKLIKDLIVRQEQAFRRRADRR